MSLNFLYTAEKELIECIKYGILKGERSIAAIQSIGKVSSKIFFTILNKKNEFKWNRCREG